MMLGDVGLRSFHVISNVVSFWIVGFIGVLRFAMMGSAHHVGRRVCIGANVGRWRRRGSVVIGIFDVRIRAGRVWSVGSMFASEGAMGASAGNALLQGRGLALVGREFMKGCLVMLRWLCVGRPVIRS